MTWHKQETIPGIRPGEKTVFWVSDNGWVIRSDYVAIPHANGSGYWVRPYFNLFDPEGVNIGRYELMIRAKKAAAEMAARRESME